jgi:hypothetical protein
LDLNADGQLPWSATVVYHLWEGEPFQVRRTTFSPRAELSVVEREQQLADVVRDGNGENTYNATNSSTRALITNLVEWEINTTASRFDAYAPSSIRRTIPLGTGLLEPGAHQITFRTAGKNPNNTSANRYLGLDTLSITPSALPLEVERLTVNAYNNTEPEAENMPETDDVRWSGNARLWFAATSDGEEFTLAFNNDQAEERNFVGTATIVENLRRFPMLKNDINTFGLRLDGNEKIWDVREQTRDTNANHTALNSNISVRYLLRGDDVTDGFDGGWLEFNGTNVWASFATAPTNYLVLGNAFIAEAQSPGNPALAMNFIPGTEEPFTFSGNWWMVGYDNVTESDPTPFVIDREKSYILGFQIYHFTNLPINLLAHTASTGPVSAFTAPGHGAVLQSDWSSRTDVVGTNTIVGLRSLRAGHSPSGTYLSQILDTRLENPTYTLFNWSERIPPGASMTVKVRAGNTPDLSDAAEWDDAPIAVNNANPSIQGRYAQVWARLQPGEIPPGGLAGYSDAPGTTLTPELHDFTLCWDGERRFVDLAGIFSSGPDHGIYEVRLNDIELLQGITFNVKVYKDVQLGRGDPKRIEARTFTEIVPRNTRR